MTVQTPADFLTLQQVADRFARSTSWVRRQAFFRVSLGRQPLFHRRACDAYTVAKLHNADRATNLHAQRAAVAAYYRQTFERTPPITQILQGMRQLFDRHRKKRVRMPWRRYTGLKAAITYAHKLINTLASKTWYADPDRPRTMPQRPPAMPVPDFFPGPLWHGLQEMVIHHAQTAYDAERRRILAEFEHAWTNGQRRPGW